MRLFAADLRATGELATGPDRRRGRRHRLEHERRRVPGTAGRGAGLDGRAVRHLAGRRLDPAAAALTAARGGVSVRGGHPAGRALLAEGRDALLALVAGEEAGGEFEQLVEAQRRRRPAAGAWSRPGRRAHRRSGGPAGRGPHRRRRRRARRGRPVRRPPRSSASKTSPVSISRCATCGTIRGSTTAEITAGHDADAAPRRRRRTPTSRRRRRRTRRAARCRPPGPARGRPRPPASAPSRSPPGASGNSRTPWSCTPPPAASAEVHAGAEHPPGVVEHEHPDGVVGQRRRRAPSRSWARIARDSALRLAGESRVRVATPRDTDTCTTRSWVTRPPHPAGPRRAARHTGSR